MNLKTVSSARPAAATSATTVGGGEHARLGVWLVLGSAVVWSFGGALGRLFDMVDSWTVIFWRSVWAALFLLCFMLIRDGLHGTIRLFANMGLPGVAVGLCFATASTSFIVALGHTTVANILLIQAGVPLIAALIAWIVFRERVTLPTWIAISVVIIGVAVMVSESFAGTLSPIGDALALLIAFCLATATVITRHFAHVRMLPAVCLGTIIAACTSAMMAGSVAVGWNDMGLLFVFGALNLGFGLALFVTGARLVAAPVVALIGTAEPVLGPLWVWLFMSETPSGRTLIGGAIVLTALVTHLGWRSRALLAHRGGESGS